MTQFEAIFFIVEFFSFSQISHFANCILIFFRKHNIFFCMIFVMIPNQCVQIIMKGTIVLLSCIGLAHSVLEQLFSVNRHGARHEPELLLENDGGWEGELSGVGMRQMQRLGMQWYSEYIETWGLINKQYKREEIEVYSTQKSRTISSAQALLRGLYMNSPPIEIPETVPPELLLPPFPSANGSVDLPSYTPIKSWTNPQIIFADCPNYPSQAQNTINNHQKQYDQIMQRYQPLREKIAELLNLTLSEVDLGKVADTFESLLVIQYLGKSLPKGFTPEDVQNTKHICNWIYLLKYRGNVAVMRNTQKYIKMFNSFDRRIEEAENYKVKWTLIVGHDFDILSYYLHLNFSSPECVESLYRTGKTSEFYCEQNGLEFGSNIIIQLHSLDSSYFVRVRSNGKYMYLCKRYSYDCPYEEFKLRLLPYISKQWSQLCGISLQNPHKG